MGGRQHSTLPPPHQPPNREDKKNLIMGYLDTLKKPATPERQYTPVELNLDEGTPYGRAALNAELAILATAPVGERNHSLNKAAFSLYQLAHQQQLNPAIVHDALVDTARSIGLDETEIHATIESATKGAWVKPRPPIQELEAFIPPEVSVLTPVSDGAGQAADAAQAVMGGLVAADDIETQFPALNLRALWDVEVEEDYIIDPILPARRTTVIYSRPKIGKSLFTLEMCAHIAQGTSFLGYTPQAPRTVLYLDFENDPIGDTVQRLKSMGFKPENLDRLKIISYPQIGGMDTTRGANTFLKIVNHYQPELVVIDTMSRAIEGDENENDTYLNFYRLTQLQLKKAGIALLRLDHAGKDESKGQRGGSAKSGDVDLVWQLREVAADQLQLVCEAKRLHIPEEIIAIKRTQTPTSHTWVNADRARQERIDGINQVLDEAGVGNQVTEREARDVLRAAGAQAKNNLLREALRQRKIRPYAFGAQLEVEVGE